jgi:glyceraldehyde-3-phosphate dehydrogenase (arsenate-transferring)
MARIAINGLGRMGKLALRAFAEDGTPGEIVLLNDAAGGPATHAHLFEFDSVHGRWPATFAHDAESVSVNGTRMLVANARRIEDLPLRDLAIDVVLDCTGVFKTVAKTQPYFDAGVRKVVVSAPIKDQAALNLVYGVNHGLYDPDRHHLVTAASCTTNCLAPVVKVLHEEIGIRHGSITTVHDVTNTQTIIDRPAKDLRRARSALNSLIPTTTGSATAIGLIYPELAGRLNGYAVRVPLLNASLTDCDGPSTMVVNGTQVKVFAWYDNEWGYARRLADVTRLVAEGL